MVALASPAFGGEISTTVTVEQPPAVGGQISTTVMTEIQRTDGEIHTPLANAGDSRHAAAITPAGVMLGLLISFTSLL